MKMNKYLIGLLFFIVPKAFAVEIKVSDKFPTLVELSGKITKVSFGNGPKEYAANVEGRFLELKAKSAKTSTTTITIYYIENEGKKSSKINVFFGDISYTSERQEIYDLTLPYTGSVKSKEDDLSYMEVSDVIGPDLKKAISYIEKAEPVLRRFSKKEGKVTCSLTNMVSTGSHILLKFCIFNESPFDYEVSNCYFVHNDTHKKNIKTLVNPKKIVVSSLEHTYAVFAIDKKLCKQGILAFFEEHNGNRNMVIPIPIRALLNIPRLQTSIKIKSKDTHA